MRRLMYGSIINQGVRIQYYRTGDEKPALIFLHGITDSAMCWNRLPLVFEPEYDVVLLDARGHGLSDAPESGYSQVDMAGDVAALVQTLELNHPVVIGHSMGAETAATFAALYPQMVSAVVLEDPPWPETLWGKDPQEVAQNAENFRQKIGYRKSLPVEEIIAIGRQEHPSWDESEYLQWAKAKQLVSPLVAQRYESQKMKWQDVVSKIKCDGLLLVAEVEKGALVTAEVAEEAKKLWRNLEVAHIPGAGHSIHREQYITTRDVIKKFLRKRRRYA